MFDATRSVIPAGARGSGLRRGISGRARPDRSGGAVAFGNAGASGSGQRLFRASPGR